MTTAARRTTAERRAVTLRKREQRERERCGHEQFTLTTHRDRAIEALIVSERLTEEEALDPAKVETEMTLVWEEWVERWLGPRHSVTDTPR